MTKPETNVYSSIDAVNQNQWDNLVGNSDRGSLFQSYLWLSVLEATLDVEPRHIVVSKDGNPIGVLPNFITNVPVASIQ
jgi:predicted N-acyltransferase